MAHCAFIYDTVEDTALNVAEFIEANRANEAQWPGWTTSVLSALYEHGYAVLDDGNGQRRILVNSPGRRLRNTLIKPANIPNTNI